MHVMFCYHMTRVEHVHHVHNKSWSRTSLSTLSNDNIFFICFCSVNINFFEDAAHPKYCHRISVNNNV